MRIVEMHIHQKELRLKQAYTMAGVVLDSLDSTIVKLVADTRSTHSVDESKHKG